MPDTVKQKDKPSRAVSIVFWVIWGFGFTQLLFHVTDIYDACMNSNYPIPSELGWGWRSIEHYFATSFGVIFCLIPTLIITYYRRKSQPFLIILILIVIILMLIDQRHTGLGFGRLIYPFIPELGGTLCLPR